MFGRAEVKDGKTPYVSYNRDERSCKFKKLARLPYLCKAHKGSYNRSNDLNDFKVNNLFFQSSQS